MTKRCIICRKEASRGYTFSCSFHTFPKDEIRRKKWIEALNLSDVSFLSTKIICSDHFDRKSFYYSDELRRRQRLRPEAVPQIRNFNESILAQSNHCRLSLTSLSNLENINYKSQEPDVMLNENCGNEETDVDIEIETEISIKEESVTSTENSVDECSSSAIMIDISNQSNNAVPEQHFLTENASNKSVNSDLIRNERKFLFPSDKQPQQVRFKDGYETKYMFRQDFVSNEAWDRFLRLMTYERSKLAIAHNKNSRKEKEVRSLKLLIKELEKIISNISPVRNLEMNATEI
ncbi:uncharacterized protein LOC105663246 isoform X2 [Megachile rotundata]|uniref:uncharacterized protein LOC105663246 isoform X2 n=1 Tax=Megachile rotundata TaxID=143995 RepID=UPI000614A972|nr:PREDICTED: uncharacterized protein LOC105663246 isoform X2 [Megachile rotundata]